MLQQASQHGVLIQVDQCGILISGPAGSGKSQLGLELISRGHRFVADDLIDVRRENQDLRARGVDESAHFLALRCGIVVAVARQYGEQAVLDSSSLDLIIAPGPALMPLQAPPQQELLGLKRPLHYLQSLPGSAICVEALARDWQDRRAGYDAAADLRQRQQHRLDAGT